MSARGISIHGRGPDDEPVPIGDPEEDWGEDDDDVDPDEDEDDDEDPMQL